MNDILFWISFVCIFTEIASQEIYEFDVNGPCCNGTLGYADVRGKMPCSALKCCDPSETVSVSPVNAALGYVFRCTLRRWYRFVPCSYQWCLSNICWTFNYDEHLQPCRCGRPIDYKRRCNGTKRRMARSADLEKRCSTRGKLLIDSKNGGTTYGTRICCKGLTIKIYLNHHFAAFAVECVDRFR